MNLTQGTRPTTRKARPESPARELLHMMLTGWVYAIPFALFFALVTGAGGKAQFLGVYFVSVVFAYCNMTANWATRNFLTPAMHRRASTASKRSQILADVAAYVGAAILGSGLAAV